MAKTFEFDEKLPSLSVPTLKETLERYEDSLKPFDIQGKVQTDEDLEKLHFLLQKRAAENKNWVTYTVQYTLSSETSILKRTYDRNDSKRPAILRFEY